jgi:hypothetical protein
MPLSDPLVDILARMVQSAIEADQRLVTWALESGATLVEPCRCRARLGEQACSCKVEPAVTRAYMIRAAARLQRRKFVGMPPRRRCLLCLRGDHDLVDTMAVTLVLPDGTIARTMRLPGLRRRSRKRDFERAERAHAFPTGTWEAQRRAADDR